MSLQLYATTLNASQPIIGWSSQSPEGSSCLCNSAVDSNHAMNAASSVSITRRLFLSLQPRSSVLRRASRRRRLNHPKALLVSATKKANTKQMYVDSLNHPKALLVSATASPAATGSTASPTSLNHPKALLVSATHRCKPSGPLPFRAVSITRRLFLSLQPSQWMLHRTEERFLSQSPEGSSCLCNGIKTRRWTSWEGI